MTRLKIRPEIGLPEIIAHSQRCTKVVLRPNDGKEKGHFELRDAIEALLIGFSSLSSAYAGCGTQTDLQAHARGETEFQTLSVNFLDPHSARRFISLVNNTSGFPYTANNSLDYKGVGRFTCKEQL